MIYVLEINGKNWIRTIEYYVVFFVDFVGEYFSRGRGFYIKVYLRFPTRRQYN